MPVWLGLTSVEAFAPAGACKVNDVRLWPESSVAGQPRLRLKVSRDLRYWEPVGRHVINPAMYRALDSVIGNRPTVC